MDIESDQLTNQLLTILEEVKDPEIPVVSVIDLGIVREVNASDEQLEVVITPTYSGCPAMLEIEKDIRSRLEENGYQNVKVRTVLSPAWTTEWMSESGKRKLEEYGIAPPNSKSPDDVNCPNCKSENTVIVSQFGSTACKSLFKCNDCLEPFDHFKCH